MRVDPSSEDYSVNQCDCATSRLFWQIYWRHVTPLFIKSDDIGYNSVAKKLMLFVLVDNALHIVMSVFA